MTILALSISEVSSLLAVLELSFVIIISLLLYRTLKVVITEFSTLS